MSLVYNVSTVKSPGFFSLGEPEPKIRSGEVIVYINENEEHFQVEAERTPVSSSFIKKNKINKRIRMNAGPFSYTFNEELFTQDHRKYVRVNLQMLLEVEDAYKLYYSNVKNIEAFLNNLIPGGLGAIVSRYSMEDIIRLQQFLQDVHVIPTLKSTLHSMGLRIAQYTIHVQKDELEINLDKGSRIKEDKNNDKIDEVFIDAKVEIAKFEAKARMLEAYQGLLNTMEPQIALQLIPEENREIVKEHWKSKGLLIAAPKEDRNSTPFD